MKLFYPVLILALAAGVSSSKLGLESMIVNPLPLLKEKGLL